MSLSVISYGGGVQSTAMIVLATQGQIDAQTALFSNVGDDSEHPATLRYVREVMTPWAAERGITVHELSRRRRDGSVETLMGRLAKPRSRSLPIPVRMDNGAPGTRSCTIDFKLRVLAKWLKAHGASAKKPARVHIGFSLDESHRVGNKRVAAHEVISYPLIDGRLNREDCKAVIREAGLPVPGKSACFFCPFHRPYVWAAMRRDEPELFEKSAALEDLLNGRRKTLGKDQVWLTRFAAPLRDVIQPAQPELFETSEPYVTGETCDEGACWV